MADLPPKETQEKRLVLSKAVFHNGKQVMLLSLPTGQNLKAVTRPSIPAAASTSTGISEGSQKIPYNFITVADDSSDSDATIEEVETKKPRKSLESKLVPMLSKPNTVTNPKGASPPTTNKIAGKETAKKQKPAAVKKEKEPADRVVWSFHSTMKIIEYYGEKKIEFTSGNQAMLWFPMAEELSRDTKQNITATHCRNKWCDLKSVYKLEVDRRKISGEGAPPPKGRKNFVDNYFDALHEILYDVPEVNPKLTLSTDNESTKKADSTEKDPKTPKSKHAMLANYYQSKLEMKERHHREKMEAIRDMKRRQDSLCEKILGAEVDHPKPKQAIKSDKLEDDLIQMEKDKAHCLQLIETLEASD